MRQVGVCVGGLPMALVVVAVVMMMGMAAATLPAEGEGEGAVKSMAVNTAALRPRDSPTTAAPDTGTDGHTLPTPSHEAVTASMTADDQDNAGAAAGGSSEHSKVMFVNTDALPHSSGKGKDNNKAAQPSLAAAKRQQLLDNLYMPFAVMASWYSAAAYCHNLHPWDCQPCKHNSNFRVEKVFHGRSTETFAYAGVDHNNRIIVVAFQGTTQTFQKWMDDLDLWMMTPSFPHQPSDTRVHEGFYTSYVEVRDHLMSTVESLLQLHASYTVMVTGHSLGGALAALCALDVRKRFPSADVHMYTFGQPRVGNRVFAEYFDAAGIDSAYRFVHHRDPVPHVPPEFVNFYHVATEVYYGEYYNKNSLHICDGSGEDDACSDQFYADTHLRDHYKYLGHDITSDTCAHASPATTTFVTSSGTVTPTQNLTTTSALWTSNATTSGSWTSSTRARANTTTSWPWTSTIVNATSTTGSWTRSTRAGVNTTTTWPWTTSKSRTTAWWSTTSYPATTTTGGELAYGVWLSKCVKLGVPYTKADGADEIPNAHSILFDFRAESQRKLIYMTWNTSSCEGAPIYEAEVDLLSTRETLNPQEQLTFERGVARLGHGLGGVVHKLNKFCPCTQRHDSHWRSGSWKMVDYDKCAQTKPPSRAPWLCEVVAGKRLTMHTKVLARSYQRDLLNTTSSKSSTPVTSPILHSLPLGRYPKAEDCDYLSWSRCGAHISKSVKACNALYKNADEDIRSACLYNKFYNTAGFNMQLCCPCVGKYAQDYAPWALLPCQSV